MSRHRIHSHNHMTTVANGLQTLINHKCIGTFILENIRSNELQLSVFLRVLVLKSDGPQLLNGHMFL